MRRPVKPFVTEYKGAARRGSATPSTSPIADLLKSEPERSEPRAASPRSAVARMAEPQEDSYEAALRAADALFSGARAAAPPSVDATPTASHDEPAPHPTGGRVLRAIDEEPSPELLRLEEQFAPKRRGRKPGSKNKPKIAAPAVVEALLADAPAAIASEPAPPAATAVERTPRVVTRALTLPPRADRYGWVRTKLKPGQQWKRRLPKIAW